MGMSRMRRGRAWGPPRVSKEGPRRLQDAQAGRGAPMVGETRVGRQAASGRTQEAIVRVAVGSAAWARLKEGER
jgi:hypothetical protein